MERISAVEVLFSKTQQRLLRALFSGMAPSEGMPYAELLRVTSAGAGGIHRELKQFLSAGPSAKSELAGGASICRMKLIRSTRNCARSRESC
jgi:hypothetical protein